MAEPFIGQIIATGFNFAPRGYANCDGQLLSIQQNTALFSLLGTTYGGNGVTTFGLPDLRGRVPIHQGQGPGLSPRVIGEVGGEENHVLSLGELPTHTHVVNASSGGATSTSPTGNVLAGGAAYSENGADTTLAPQSISTTGSNQGHNNLQPFLVVNYCIALNGIFPSRN
ncbi:MAG: tail fiber protein [Myxococcota bacterium]